MAIEIDRGPSFFSTSFSLAILRRTGYLYIGRDFTVFFPMVNPIFRGPGYELLPRPSRAYFNLYEK